MSIFAKLVRFILFLFATSCICIPERKSSSIEKNTSSIRLRAASSLSSSSIVDANSFRGGIDP
jgi:hypothetical protein